ncbi:family 43 glycosylhydrolase [Kribbella shirazensis]|uniref:Beta-xylosidase n=1 Tax=Kribbella shirazensis TaxID=1105143 RepID=A0A7X6A3K7_9ACTN|nr:family 43 glycosylhydrolase [Kribbella shirazensis]NIK60527.1 beta-xylosidase [Kribbella shirazensis]
MSSLRTSFVAGLTGLVALASSLGAGGAASADPPRTATPVFSQLAADPGVVQVGSEFYAFATGALTRALHGESERGPWQLLGTGLTRRPEWSVADGMWAPDAVHVSGDRWVLYYAARVSGLGPNQRCIGTAISTTGPAGPYDPGNLPPIACPKGATWPDGVTPLIASDQPDTGDLDGFIDPVPFQASDGRRYVIFKKQRPPVTILRIVEVQADWLTPVAPSSVIVTRTDGQIENAVMVERAGRFYLFASWDNWANCDYRTVWLTSGSPTAGFTFPEGFPDRTSVAGGTLMKSSDNGVCGPGGADMVVNAGTGGDADDTVMQMFFHGWICDPATVRPCADNADVAATDGEIRTLYSAMVGWRSDGSPFVVRYETPTS